MKYVIRDIFKYTIIALCFVAYFFAAFYDGDLPIKNIEDFRGWIAMVGVLVYFFI